MRRIKATAGRVVLTTCALAGVGIGVAMPVSAVPDNGTLSVSPTTFAVNETATATADNCPNGVIQLILNGISVDSYYTDAVDDSHSISLVGADLGVGTGNISGVCFDVIGGAEDQDWSARFVYSNVSFTVTEVPTTTQAATETTATPVTTAPAAPGAPGAPGAPAPTETTVASAGANPTTAPAGVTATTAAAVDAAGPAVAAAGASAQSLPATGQGSEHAAAVAVALLAIGVGALLLGRRTPAV